MNQPEPDLARAAAPPETVIPAHLLRQAREKPDAVAVTEIESGRSWTWRQFTAECLVWAGGFERIGVAPGDRILTMVPNSVNSFTAWLGAAWLRAIEVPVNTGYRGRMLSYVAQNSGARVAVVAERYLGRLAEIAGEIAQLETVIVPDASGRPNDLPFTVLTRADFLDGVTADMERTPPGKHDVAAMIYTSGTTGPSKGVLVPWAAVYEVANGMAAGFVPRGGAYYSMYPAFHISGKSGIIFALVNDARVVLRETFSASRFWSDVRTHRCTSAMIMGPIASVLMSAPEAGDDTDNPLRYTAIGPMSDQTEAFKRRFGVEVTTSYGTTEIGMPLAAGWDLPNTRTCGRVRQGYPGYEVRVVDEFDEPVAPGEVGELLVRSQEPWTMSIGYHGMPDKTAEAWRNGWFHTGDAFRVDDDGWFYFVDRMKDTIRRRGENISSFEIEAGVNEHVDVLESVAIGVPSDLGEDDPMIFVVARPGAALTAESLVDFLTERMPKFMIPRYVEFVTELPKTDASFRARKFELRARGVGPNTWDREAAAS
jgi:crotonobetaine/carnitine-CoA ligase